MNRKSILKKGVIITAICALMASLTACGSSNGGSSDPNVGTYDATVVEMSGITMDVADIYEDGLSIELKDKGKAKFIYEGEDYGMKWSLDGESFSAEGGGAELEGTLSDGVLVLEDLLGSGMSITLVNSEFAPGGSVLDKLEKYASGDFSVGNDYGYDDDEDDWDIDWDTDDSEDDGEDSDVVGGLAEPDANHQDAGYYELWWMSAEGQEFDRDDIDSLGYYIGITLYPDGTGFFSYSNYPDDQVEWSDGDIYIAAEDQRFLYTKEDDKIWLDDEVSGATMIFKYMSAVDSKSSSGSSSDSSDSSASSSGLSEGAKKRGLSADLFGSGEATVDQIAQAYKWLGEQDDKYNDPEIFDKLCKQIGGKPKDENDSWDNTEKAYFQWDASDGDGLLFVNFEIKGSDLMLSGYNISGGDVTDRYNEIK